MIALHSKGWKPGTNLPSKWRQTFRDYVLPKIGSKPVGAVTTADVMAVLTPIWTTKPGAARGVGGVYQRSDLFDERREVMDRWAEVVAGR